VARFWDGKQWTEATLPSQYTPPELVVPRPEATSAPTSQPQVYIPAKNPGIAVLLSFFLPGGGNLYAGSTAAGVVLLICWFVSWLFMLAAMPVFRDRLDRGDGHRVRRGRQVQPTQRSQRPLICQRRQTVRNFP
jgi:Protein of unknown function (DUF2510)